MSARVCVIPGDGIGVEVVEVARNLLGLAAPDVECLEADAGWEAFEHGGCALPGRTLESARSADAVLFGAVSSPSRPVDGYESPIVRLRRELGLHACLRPVRSPAGRSPAVDLVIVRENTEGLYAGRERRRAGAAVTSRVITERATRRIAQTALELARRRRCRVAVVHKANVLRATCGLFREVVLDVLSEAPDVDAEELLVDNAAYQLVARPERFDVIVTANLFGDILSDVAAHHAGGLGVVASANVGGGHGLFEPVHGSAPDIAGRGIANPLAAVRAVGLLLEHLGRVGPARAVERAVGHVLVAGPRTPDLGGTAATGDVAAAVYRAFQALSPADQSFAKNPAPRTPGVPDVNILGENSVQSGKWAPETK